MDTQEARSEHYTDTNGFTSAAEVQAAALALSHIAEIPGRTAHRKSSYDRGVQIAAAKVRVATDRRLGETTPDWIKALAAERPRSKAS